MPGPAPGLRLGGSSRHWWHAGAPGHSIEIDPVRPGYTAISRARACAHGARGLKKPQQLRSRAPGAKFAEPTACMVATTTAASLWALIKSRTRAICSSSLRA